MTESKEPSSATAIIDNKYTFPFEIDYESAVKSPSPIETEYSETCIPSKFKSPSTAKAKKLLYEEIEPNFYEPQAHMAAFRVKTKDRLLAWIHALGVIYYDYFGKVEDGYHVHWYDEKWEQESKAICIDLTKDMKLLYKITLFINTGIIQAQGHSKDIFEQRDFPALKHVVELTLTASEEDQKVLSRATDQQNTVPKVLQDIHVGSKQKDINQNLVQQVQPDENNLVPVTSTKQSTLTITFQDISQLQSSFVEALEKVTKSQAEFIKTAESGFSAAISNALKPVVSAVDKLQRQINEFQSVKKDLLATSKEDLHPKVVKLESHNRELEKEVQTLQNDKRKAANDFLELESQYKAEKTQSSLNNKRYDKIIKDLQEDNASISKKCQDLRCDMQKMSDENRVLKEKNDKQFEEILSLKTQFSSMFIQQESQHEQRNEDFSRHAKPTALLIGTSNTNNINENKLSNNVSTTKVLAYTLDETLKAVQDHTSNPDIVILHSLTNDVKTLNPTSCLEKLENIVNTINEKWVNAKCIISLTTPRLDDRSHKINCEILDGMTKSKYLDNKDVYISDNTNMWHGVTPVADLLLSDKYHLNDKGASILASNIRNALHTMLGIRQQNNPRGRYGRSYRGRRGRFYR